MMNTADDWSYTTVPQAAIGKSINGHVVGCSAAFSMNGMMYVRGTKPPSTAGATITARSAGATTM